MTAAHWYMTAACWYMTVCVCDLRNYVYRACTCANYQLHALKWNGTNAIIQTLLLYVHVCLPVHTSTVVMVCIYVMYTV